MTGDVRRLLTQGLTKPLEDVLRTREIEPGDPGPILLDIQTLIDAIGEGVATTSKYFVLPQGRLDDFNDRLREPLTHRLKRPQLRSFPTLMGLLMLLRSTGLAVGETVPKRIVRIDPEMLAQWSAFDATEKYMNLLECWLTTASLGTVGERTRWAGMAHEIKRVYFRLDEEETMFGNDRFGIAYGIQNSVTLSLLHQFGWVRLEYDAMAEEGKTARLRSVRRLPLGDAMIAATCGIGRFVHDDDSASLRGVLGAFFPQWKRSLIIPEPEFREGEHTLKVSLGRVWRRIAAPAETSLDDFACDVLNAFDFDHDHLYQFTYRDRQGMEVQAVAPEIRDAEVFADEVRLGQVPISAGDTITMLYDFGDSWDFHVKLEQISDKPSRRTGPRVIKRSGTAPKQYVYDDWD